MMKYVMRESAQLGSFFLNKGTFLYATPSNTSPEKRFHHESAEIASAVTESYARILLDHMGV